MSFALPFFDTCAFAPNEEKIRRIRVGQRKKTIKWVNMKQFHWENACYLNKSIRISDLFGNLPDEALV